MLRILEINRYINYFVRQEQHALSDLPAISKSVIITGYCNIAIKSYRPGTAASRLKLQGISRYRELGYKHLNDRVIVISSLRVVNELLDIKQTSVK